MDSASHGGAQLTSPFKSSSVQDSLKPLAAAHFTLPPGCFQHISEHSEGMEPGQSHQKTQDSSSWQPLPKASPSHRPGRDLLRIAPCGLRLFLPNSSFLLCFPQRSDLHHSLKAHLNSSCLPFILSRCPTPLINPGIIMPAHVVPSWHLLLFSEDLN